MKNNKILTSPSRPPIGQVVGGTNGNYALNGNLAFFRDDFQESSFDADHWDTSITSGSSGAISPSAGNARFVGATSGVAGGWSIKLTGKDKFSIPMRAQWVFTATAASTAETVTFRVRDTAALNIAELVLSPTAITAVSSAVMNVRAGSTAAGYIASAGTATASAAIVATSYSAAVCAVIDVTHKNVTFAMFSATAFNASGAFTASAANLLYQFNTLVPLTTKRYVIETEYTITTTVGGSGPTGSLKVDSILVEQLVPVRDYVDPAAATTTLLRY